MDGILIQNASLVSIADEIRSLSNTTESMTPNMMKENLQLANSEVSNQTVLLEQALSLLDNKTFTDIENCNFNLILTNFESRIIVAIYTYLNNEKQLETTELEFSAAGSYDISVLKNSQVLFMGVSGVAPIARIDEGGVVSLRSFSDGAYYYAYSFGCTDDCSVEF